MYIHNPKTAIAYRSIYLVLCVIGIYINLVPFTKSKILHMLSYFTILSNLLCMFVFIWCILISYHSLKTGKLAYYNRVIVFFKGLATTSIVLASIAFHFMLRQDGLDFTPNGMLIVSNKDLFVHYLIPFLTVGDWFLFQPKGLFRKQYPLIFMIYPFTYFYIVMLKTPYSSTYPYFFMNIAENGISTFFRYIIYVTILSFLIGFLLYVADYFIARYFPTSSSSQK